VRAMAISEGCLLFGMTLGFGIFQSSASPSASRVMSYDRSRPDMAERNCSVRRCDEGFEIGLVGTVFRFEAPVLEARRTVANKLLTFRRASEDSRKRRCEWPPGLSEISCTAVYHHDRHIGILFLGAFQEADAVHIASSNRRDKLERIPRRKQRERLTCRRPPADTGSH